MADKLVESLDDLEKYGYRWEKQKDLDSRYLPPPPPEKMRVPGAAFIGGTGQHKAVAALENQGEEETTLSKPTKQNEMKAAKNAPKNGGCPSSRASDGESKVVTAKVVERSAPLEEADEAKAYAAAMQGGQRLQGAPGNQYWPGCGYVNDARRGAIGFGQAPDGWQTMPPRGGYGRSGGANQPPDGRANEQLFPGVCNLCQAVGYRASVSGCGMFLVPAERAHDAQLSNKKPTSGGLPLELPNV